MNWSFKVFKTSGGRNIMDEWLNGLPVEDQAAIEARINLLKGTPVGDITHYFDKRKESEKIFEIRIKGHRVQYRPLGSFGFGQGIFIILAGAKEKDGKLKPPTIINTAEERRQFALGDPERYLDEY
jgi:hypothetical protein